jgi:uncharacterized membrane protein (UPF0127 family)
MRARRAVLAALLGLAVACAAKAQPLRSGLTTTRVTVRGVTLTVEVARTPVEQMRGLGGRTWIDPNGGMLFPFGGPHVTAFVMRDCPIPIDVAFLDEGGRVLSIHEMKPEAPRRSDESVEVYETRLHAYPSGLPAWFALETAGGRLRELGVQAGDRIEVAPTAP